MASISRFTVLALATREQLAQQTAAFFARVLEGALNTQRAYCSDLNQLRVWLAARELGELPVSSAAPAYRTFPFWIDQNPPTDYFCCHSDQSVPARGLA